MKRLKIKPLGVSVYFYLPMEKDKYEQINGTLPDRVVGFYNENHIWIKENDFSTILHECSHVTDWIIHNHLEISGHIRESNNELSTYLLEFIYQEALQYYNKELSNDKTKNTI